MALSPPLEELIERSRRLGADRATTNFGGGNTSAKGVATDPVTGEEVEVLWVKGSGGDLRTLTESGVSMLRQDRIRALRDQYVGPDQDDELHQLLDHCVFGAPRAAPSIDTSMHAILPAVHVDHLHPDAVIALAASADGEALTHDIFGDEIGWVPWQRPGFDLALKIEALRESNSRLRGVVMGGHGLTTWADTSDECEHLSLDVIRRAGEFIEQHGRPEPLGGLRKGFEPLDRKGRQRRALALGPVIRGLASTDRPVVGHWVDDDIVLDFIGREAAPRVVPLGTSCPDHFIRTKVRPLLLDLPTDAGPDEQISRLSELHEEYRTDYRRYYEQYAGPDTSPMRGADPAIFLIPGTGMFSFGTDFQTARLAGEFYLNAINVIYGAEAVSTYTPVPEEEKFGVEYWLLEDLKLRRRPAPRPLTGRAVAIASDDHELRQAVATQFDEAGAVVMQAADGDTTGAVRTAVFAFGGVDVVLGSFAAAVETALTAQGRGGHVILLDDTDPAELARKLAPHDIRVNRLIGGDPDQIARATRALVDGSLDTNGQTIAVGAMKQEDK